MRSEAVPCRLCGGTDGDGHLFGDCTFPPLVHLQKSLKSLEFSGALAQAHPVAWLVTWTFWGWGGGPWALRPDDVANTRLDCALGTHPADLCSAWVMESQYAHEVAGYMPDNPNVWFDGSCVTDELACISVAGGGGFFLLNLAWLGIRGAGNTLMMWHLTTAWEVKGVASSVMFLGHCSPFRELNFGELFWPFRLAGNLLSGTWKRRPLHLVKDGDLLQYISDILCIRGASTVQECKVKGHATNDMVTSGRVRRADLEGNNSADEAADLGRRREKVATARGICLQACCTWYPLMMHFHRYLVATS